MDPIATGGLSATAWAYLITGLVIAVALVIAFIKANLHICAPNEVLIFSGRRRRLPDGSVVGYRIIRGGRSFKVPIVEVVHRVSLATMPIELSISGGLSAGVIPLNVAGTANVKVAGTEEAGLFNAVERFLGRSGDHISQVAREVLEGNLRGVLATLSPEEANSRRLEFAQRVIQEAREDLGNLGLVLDTFKILHIADDQGYLEAIGRRRNAEVRRDARIAEAEADAEARRVAADAARKGSVAEAEAQMDVVASENRLRTRSAELAADTNQAEERARMAGEIARVVEQQRLEEQRVDLNRSRSEAEVVVPARAEKEAGELRAAGQAARIIEDGKATAEAVRLMREQWADGQTRELFLIQQLPDIIGKITDMMADNLSIEKLTIVDGGDGHGMPSLMHGLTNSVVTVMEQLKNATGLDIAEILQTRAREQAGLKREL